jgi:predicted RNA-binding Zn ribbon-like protein
MLPVSYSGVNQQSRYSGVVTVDLLVDFLNTFDTEELPDDAAARAWFRARGLPTAELRADEARAVREALRRAADGHRPRPDDLALVPLHAAVGDDGEVTLASDHPLGPLVATAVRLAFDGRWDRLKLCDMHTCRYAFFDSSRNRSGRWCSMAICGNRAKTRAFRDRHSRA